VRPLAAPLEFQASRHKKTRRVAGCMCPWFVRDRPSVRATPPARQRPDDDDGARGGRERTWRTSV